MTPPDDRLPDRDHPDESAPDVCPFCARDIEDDGDCPSCGNLREAARERRDDWKERKRTWSER